jgi:cytochrome oxidase Cu insertion factor (SCO1/SenC/PrrC family)
MRTRTSVVLLLWILTLALPTTGSRLWAQSDKKDTPPPTKFKVGDTAPDFTLLDQNRKEIKLSDFRGKKSVALAFYVFAFTGG